MTPAGEEQETSFKKRLLAAIAAASPDDVTAMLDRLWPLGPFSVRAAPRAGLVMVTVRDPFDTPFHLGEALVSEAEVEFDGHTGYGAVCGDEPEQALLLAAVAAVERSGRTAVLNAIAAPLDQIEAKSADRKALSSRLAAATEVRFESMKKERVDFGSLGG
ncbi:MAG TPA: phosphonate C-P lyase system protein PhnG [Desulfobacterales bacterium]|nr:phosphonate C-P lyase system protein PhnG [Desulfobacterales bacterium]